MVIDLPDDFSQGDNVHDSYDFDMIVALTHNSWVNRHSDTINLPIGILRRVQVNFPNGCNFRIMANIYHGVDQLFPLDAGGGPGTSFYCFNNLLLDFNAFEIIDAATTAFTLNGWGDGGADLDWTHTIHFGFLVERVSVP